jgi:hypothetical protein
MRKLLITFLCLYSTQSFAQNGFFLLPELGAGMSNTSWKPQASVASYPGQNSIFSWQGQLDLGYKAGKWQFITGLGYLRTGVNMKNGDENEFNNYKFVPADINSVWPLVVPGVTDYNPHYIVPVKVGYEMHQFNNKLSFLPVIGAEFTNNLPRTFAVGHNPKQAESQDDFTYNCNRKGITAMLQLNFEYIVNRHYDFTFGPSVHYMYTSELNFEDQHDYAFLMNLGLRWNFKARKQNG